MVGLFSSGRIVDCIVAIMLLELGMLALLRKRGLIQFALLPLAVNSAAGAALLLSLRAALRQDPWPSIAMWLCVALIAHASDLWIRLRTEGTTAPSR